MSELRENMVESTTLSPSAVCHKYQIQNCHACENAECGDNCTPSIVALLKRVGELEGMKDLAVFMVQSYCQIRDLVYGKWVKEEKPDLVGEFPMIQGTPTNIQLDRISEMKVDSNSIGNALKALTAQEGE